MGLLLDNAEQLRFGVSALAQEVCMGLIIGSIQAPFLANRLPGIRWWYWIISHIIALPFMFAFSSFILDLLGILDPEWWIESALYGFPFGSITGIVLVYYVRRT